MRYLRNLTLGLVVLLVILWLGVSFRGYLSAQTTLQQWKAIHPCDADAVAFSVDGSLLAVTCSQDHVYVYRFPQLTREATLPVKEGRAFSAAFAPRRAVLAVAEWAGGLTLWDSTRWTRLREVGAPGRTNAVAWSPEGSLLAASVGASGWCVSVYKTEGYQEVYRFTAQGSSAFGP
ncbi:MAG: hypothetical protein NZ749_10100, partial [bacterium]|nr:hypothetical protein [bacterium]